MLIDYLWKALHASLITFTVLFVAFVLFWALRGFLPGSVIVEMPPPTQYIPGGAGSGSGSGSGRGSSPTAPYDADFNFYYVNWCPFSVDALPAVRSLNTLVKNAKYGFATVRVNFIDCETEVEKCRVANVDGYPSYSLVAPQKTFHYAGPPKTATYEQFLVSALGPKKTAPSA